MNAFTSCASCAYHIPVSSTSCRFFPCTDCSPSSRYYNLISSPWGRLIDLHFGSTSCSTGTQRPTGRAPSCTPSSPCDLWTGSGRWPSAWCRREQCRRWVCGGKRNTSRSHKAWMHHLSRNPVAWHLHPGKTSTFGRPGTRARPSSFDGWPPERSFISATRLLQVVDVSGVSERPCSSRSAPRTNFGRDCDGISPRVTRTCRKSNRRYRLALRVRYLVRKKVDNLTLASILAGTAGKGEFGSFFGKCVVAADAIFLCFC